jgi:Uma2 family endonuclease
MGMAQATKVWTVDDLQHLPDDGFRYEVIDGELLVTPAATLDHQEAIARLHLLLAPYVAEHRCGHVVFAPADVVFSPRRGVQPDLFVVPLVDGRRPKRFADAGRLLLAVEVLSPSTARADRVKKRRVYREERVDEYWIVDLDARVIERSTPEDDRVEVVADLIEWSPEGTSGPLVVDVETYFAAVLDFGGNPAE